MRKCSTTAEKKRKQQWLQGEKQEKEAQEARNVIGMLKSAKFGKEARKMQKRWRERNRKKCGTIHSLFPGSSKPLTHYSTAQYHPTERLWWGKHFLPRKHRKNHRNTKKKSRAARTLQNSKMARARILVDESRVREISPSASNWKKRSCASCVEPSKTNGNWEWEKRRSWCREKSQTSRVMFLAFWGCFWQTTWHAHFSQNDLEKQNHVRPERRRGDFRATFKV